MASCGREDIDPHLSDDAIKAGFTPLEKKYYDWSKTDEFKEADDAGVHRLSAVLRERFGEDAAHYLEFASKWFGRFRRRTQCPVSPAKLRHRLSDTPCNDADKLAETLWVTDVCNVPDLFIGESSFGGVQTGYVIDIGSRYLYPDDEPSNPGGPYLIDYAVMAMDIDVDHGALPLERQDSKKGHSKRNSSDSIISVRSATSEDFEDRRPFTFLQIGMLMYCSGEEWAKVRDQGQEAISDAEWDATGYGVVIRLDRNSQPTGAVYVLYNFQQSRLIAGEGGPMWEEIDWRDGDKERPHIRRLYPEANQKFFLAKIADKLEDLQPGEQFEFEVVAEQRQYLTRAKKAGVHQMIIPADIFEIVSKAEEEPISGDTEDLIGEESTPHFMDKMEEVSKDELSLFRMVDIKEDDKDTDQPAIHDEPAEPSKDEQTQSDADADQMDVEVSDDDKDMHQPATPDTLEDEPRENEQTRNGADEMEVEIEMGAKLDVDMKIDADMEADEAVDDKESIAKR